MTNISLEEAQRTLPELVAGLRVGEEIMIIDQGRPLAQLKRADMQSVPCKAGCYQKKDFWMADDFDASLEEFKEYME